MRVIRTDHNGLLRSPDDRGMTLTELLIVMVVLGIIFVPLSNALIGFIRFTDQTSQQLNESHDVQLAAAYFGQDVQSVGVRDWGSYPYQLLPSLERAAPATGGLVSPLKGEATLTDAQAADLAAGKWYFNVHTAANKGGEIRGQVMKK